MADDYKVESLPKWAQEKIARLEAQVARLEAQVARLEAERGQPADGAAVAWSEDYQHWYSLPEEASVDFRVAGQGWDLDKPARVKAKLTATGLLGLYAPSGVLLVFPRSSNAIEIKVGQ